ncbi:Helicase 2 [Dikerogammarus haemobaphes nudivirus]|nr:Helicase 2 [Dikerogammarus haemobaphes nudivirus]
MEALIKFLKYSTFSDNDKDMIKKIIISDDDKSLSLMIISSISNLKNTEEIKCEIFKYLKIKLPQLNNVIIPNNSNEIIIKNNNDNINNTTDNNTINMGSTTNTNNPSSNKNNDAIKSRTSTKIIINTINKEQQKREDVDIKLPKLLSLTTNKKIQTGFDQLNNNQKEAFNKLHEIFSSSLDINTLEIDSPKIVILDAPGGTGKSYLVESIVDSLEWEVVVIVKANKLIKLFKPSANLHVMSTCKYIMKTFSVDYQNAIKLFNDELTIESMVMKIYNLLCNVTNPIQNMKLLVVDEYSLESPIFLLILSLATLKFNFNLLLIGDQKQQNTIQKSVYNTSSNYNLLSKFKITNLELEKQMRIKDAKYLKKVNLVREKIDSATQTNGDVILDFSFQYFIFEIFKPYFFKNEDLCKVIYITDTHNKIRNRIIKIEQEAEKNNIKTLQAPFYVVEEAEENKLSILKLPDNYKFLPYLLLVVGARYIFKTLDQEIIIELIEIHNDYILGLNLKTKTNCIIKKCIWSAFFHPCVEEQFIWISSFTTCSILQYPLRPLVLTFHSVQGLTFNNEEQISFDLDVKTLNSIYVAISRICSDKQLCMIHSKYSLSFLYTMYKNDEYYYQLRNPLKATIVELCKFLTNSSHTFDDSKMIACRKIVNTKKEFEASKVQITAVLKSVYNNVNNKKQQKDTDSILLLMYNFFMNDIKLLSDKKLSNLDLIRQFSNFIEDTLKTNKLEPNHKKQRTS